jgi:hypothetical protein
MNYWQKQVAPLYPDLAWNRPEQKSQAGHLSIIGGHSGSFKVLADIAATAETLGLGKTTTYLPASLSAKIPHSTEIFFEPATESGSFARDALRDLQVAVSLADFTILPGDLSKNTETSTMIAELVAQTSQPLLVTRDAFDTILPDAQNFIQRPNLTLLISLPQLQSLAKTLYYPRPILLSQPLLPVLETIHKFTTTYPQLTLATLHQGQIITARTGQVITTDLTLTAYTPVSIWAGPLAAKIATYMIWNPTQPLEAATGATLVP